MKYLPLLLVFSVGCMVPIRRNEEISGKPSTIRDCAKSCDDTNMKTYEDDFLKCHCFDKPKAE